MEELDLGDAATKTDIMEWMINTQLGRRNLIPAQKLTVLDKFKKRVAEEAKERQGNRSDLTSAPIGANVDKKPRTDVQVAKMAGVGTGTVADIIRL